jgi:ElaB/YqjD/DUF883 family membrane-anchored ribosome-binding protein
MVNNGETPARALQEKADTAAYRVRREARRVRREVADAFDAGVHDARRTMRHSRHAVENVFDDVEDAIRRVPVRSVVAGFAAGALLGVVMMLAVRRRPQPEI